MPIEILAEFMNEFWEYMKKYHDPVDDESFWETLVKEGEALGNKYGNYFAKGMIMVCVDDIERRWKEQTGSRYIKSILLDTLYERLRKQDERTT